MTSSSAPTERAVQDLGSIKLYLKVFDTLSLGKKKFRGGCRVGTAFEPLGAALEEVSASRG